MCVLEILRPYSGMVPGHLLSLRLNFAQRHSLPLSYYSPSPLAAASLGDENTSGSHDSGPWQVSVGGQHDAESPKSPETCWTQIAAFGRVAQPCTSSAFPISDHGL